MNQKGRVLRSQWANAERLRPHDKKAIEKLKREFATVRLEEYIERTLAAFPPLTSDQREHLRALLADAPQQAGAA